MTPSNDPYLDYNHRFPEKDGYEYVMAPELIRNPCFEALLREALAADKPLTQARISQDFDVCWDEGVHD